MWNFLVLWDFLFSIQDIRRKIYGHHWFSHEIRVEGWQFLGELSKDEG